MKTDTQIQSDVMQALTWDPSVTQSLIGVSVSDGIVTLSGSVPSYIEKFSAEKAAQRVTGVKAIVEKIKVKYEGSYERDDQDLAKAITDHFNWNYQVPEELIKAEVENGIVELTGEVEWDYQRTAAESCILGLTGIKGFTNNISIKAKDVRSETIKEEIEDALKSEAEAEARRITVDVSGSKVTLSGDVHSYSEKDDAKWAAWGTSGVTSVENNLHVNSYQ
jgi:osmotically-inducible protein OsmY